MEAQAALFYITTPTKEHAKQIAHQLLHERLIACANILPDMESVYEWKNQIEHAGECVMLLKSRRDLESKIVERVRALHDYESPCIVTLPIGGGDPEFLSWIGSQTS